MSRPVKQRGWAGWFLAGVAALAAVVPAARLLSQTREPAPPELVRHAVANEVAANNNTSGPRFMFKDERRTARSVQTKLLVETREATAGMLIAINGQPLPPEQQRAEEARLEHYVRNPEELNRKRKQEREDAERTSRIVKALPDAFLYEADGKQTGTESVGHPGDELVRLKFRPNPDYDPPSRVEQVLTGMQGHLLIDPKANRIAEIDATLQRDVGFGWGILGHLDRGGHFQVQQAAVDNHWQLTRMDLAFTGKVLLFKKINIRSTDVFSGFRPVPSDLSFAQGVELLKKAKAQEQAAAATPQKPPDLGQGKKASRQNPGEVEDKDQLCCDH